MLAKQNRNHEIILPVIVLVLMALQSILGILFPGVYRDNAFVSTTWKGNDLLTLILAVPLFILAITLTLRNSLRGKLLLIGLLDYTLYNYAFYLFAAAFNRFFLIYVILFGLSIFALIRAVLAVDLNQVKAALQPKAPLGLIAGYMFFVAAGLSLVYLTQSIGFIFTDRLPDIVIRSGHPTSIVFALDMTLLIPFFVVGAVYLLKREAIGVIISAAILVKGVIYTSILLLNTVLVSSMPGSSNSIELPLWTTLTMLGALAVFLLYRNIVSETKSA